MNFNKCLISVGNDHHSNMSKQIEQKEPFEGRDVLKQIKRALASNSLCCYYEKTYLSWVYIVEKVLTRFLNFLLKLRTMEGLSSSLKHKTCLSTTERL